MLRVTSARNIITKDLVKKWHIRQNIHSSSRLFNSSKDVLPDDKPSTKIMTVPNMITMSRIAVTPFIGHFIMTNNLSPALGAFAYCCVTDFFDGHIARKYKLNSVAGSILDPIADKLLMLVTTVSMTLPTGPALIPIPIALLILGRDFGLGVAGFFIRFTSMRYKYGSVTWKSYWNFFKYPSVIIKPSQISKWNTFLQMIYLGLGVVILITDSKPNDDDVYIEEEGKENDEYYAKNLALSSFKWLGFIVGGTTILSGASYVFSKNAIKYIKS